MSKRREGTEVRGMCASSGAEKCTRTEKNTAGNSQLVQLARLGGSSSSKVLTSWLLRSIMVLTWIAKMIANDTSVIWPPDRGLISLLSPASVKEAYKGGCQEMSR